MRDLKHLLYFENLLQEANNELVQKAVKEDGKLALGYTCYHVPEVLLNLDNCVSVRLRAPRTGSVDIATYYLSPFICGFAKALLERGIEGGYGFLSALFAGETCSEMNRTIEHFELLRLVDNDKFFVSIFDMPFKTNEHCLESYVNQIRLKVLDKLKDVYGVDTSDEAMRKAVELHNRVCRAITAIGEFRKEENPRITGYEFHVLCLATYACPKYLIVDKLEETLEEIKHREPDPKKFYRARIVLAGSEIDDPSLTKLIEDCGALVVSDRYCFGSTPGREAIELNDDEPALDQICRHYMEVSESARYISDEKVAQRRQTADRLAREYNADGIIYEQMKFCDYWGFERALASHIMSTEMGWPVLSIDRPYNARSSGQLRTRFQAFVESLEIKRIQKNGGSN